MTHSFKLSRRIARLRALFFSPLILAFAACDSADSLNSDSSLDPGVDLPTAGDELIATIEEDTPIEDGLTDLEGTELAPAEPTLASASFAGGIPFGHFSLPYSWLGSTYNGTMTLASPKSLRSVLGSAKSKGAKLLVNFTGSPRYYVDAAGNFSLSKWKQRMDRYKGVNIDDFIRDGTVIGHWLIDEPNDPSNWNGKRVSPSTLEEMAAYSKKYWPNMPTVIRVDPSYLSYNHRHVDVAWAQYLYRRGDASDYIKRTVRDAQNRGLALIVGMNVLKGGKPNGTKMDAGEIKTWGSALLSSSYPCAFINWKYNDSYLSTSSIRDAMKTLRTKAQNRSLRSCRAS